MSWRTLVTPRPGYAIRTHNRWLSNWVAYRARAARDTSNFRVIRIASKRIIFEVENERDSGRTTRTYRTVLVAAVLAALMISIAMFSIAAAMTPQSSNLADTHVSLKQPTCVDLQSLQAFETVDNAQAFALDGWHFVVVSEIVSLGQLASADYFATCSGQTRHIRVLFVRQGERWHIEKVAPTK